MSSMHGGPPVEWVKVSSRRTCWPSSSSSTSTVLGSLNVTPNRALKWAMPSEMSLTRMPTWSMFAAVTSGRYPSPRGRRSASAEVGDHAVAEELHGLGGGEVGEPDVDALDAAPRQLAEVVH